MPSTAQPSVSVAVLDSSPDFMTILCEVLEEFGFQPFAMQVFEAKQQPLLLKKLLRDRNPRVVIFDVALPYDVNWAFLQDMREWPESQGRGFVVTSTNVKRLAEVVAEARLEGVLELVGKPYDLRELARAVCSYLKDEPPCDEQNR